MKPTMVRRRPKLRSRKPLLRKAPLQRNAPLKRLMAALRTVELAMAERKLSPRPPWAAEAGPTSEL